MQHEMLCICKSITEHACCSTRKKKERESRRHNAMLRRWPDKKDLCQSYNYGKSRVVKRLIIAVEAF
jgi:hypothetical protein